MSSVSKPMPMEDILSAVHELIESAQSAAATFVALVDIVAEREGDTSFLKALHRLDVATEQRRLEKWLRATLEREPPPSDIVAFRFGLFNPVSKLGVTSADLYVAGSTRRPEQDADWAVRPAYWPKRRYSESPLLAVIYERAYARGGPATRGEYFCLWYSSLAVAQLCRDMGTLMLADKERRIIVVGFDDGDEVVVGEVTARGLKPSAYQPPTLPEIVRTDNSAAFYRLKDDTRGRWWLEEPTTASGGELPSGFASRGRPIDVTEPLVTMVMDEPAGQPAEFTFAVLDSPIVSKRVQELVWTLVGSDVQFVPVKIVGHEGEFAILNVVRQQACLDMDRSAYAAYEAGHRLAGKVYSVQKAVLDAGCVPDSNVFRLAEEVSCIVVSRALKQLLEAGKVSGIAFEPLELNG